MFFIAVCVFNLLLNGAEVMAQDFGQYRIHIGGDGALFYFINFTISFILFAECSTIAAKSLNPLSFSFLGVILLVGMGVNLLGLAVVYSNDGISGLDSEFIESFYGVVSIMELMGVCLVTFNGLHRISEYFSARTASNVYGVLRGMDNHKINLTLPKRL